MDPGAKLSSRAGFHSSGRVINRSQFLLNETDSLPSTAVSRSVSEMSDAGKHHRQSTLIRRSDDFGIAQ
jgi:hypothetical protein